MSPLVVCQDILCQLGERLVLDGATLELAEGESVGLLGGSGSGKSTLLRLIAGLETCERGAIVIGGRTVTQNGRLLVAPHRRGVAMLFQDLALWPNLSAAENVRLGLAGLRLPRDELRRRVGDMLRLCSIEELAHRRPGTLSGGQQQRVALARALAPQPRLLLLDEPLGGLDVVTKDAIVSQIAQLKADRGFSVLLVTHDPAEVRALCQTLAVLEDGRIKDRGPLADIASHPTTTLGRAFSRLLAQTG